MGASFSGAVLTGGASRRMGRDKALVLVDGETLGERVVDALRRAGASDVSVGRLQYVFESKSWSFEALKRQLHDRTNEE